MGASAAPQERRKYARIATEQMISFAPLDQRSGLGVSRDVSLGGIRFECIGCEIGLGEVLRVAFNVGEHTVSAVGRVAWVTDLDALSAEVGIEFLEIDPVAMRLLDEAFEH